jgi:hypothetical protein
MSFKGLYIHNFLNKYLLCCSIFIKIIPHSIHNEQTDGAHIGVYSNSVEHQRFLILPLNK